MKTRNFSLLLSSFLCVTALGGCVKNATVNINENPDPAQNQTETETKEAQSDQEKEESSEEGSSEKESSDHQTAADQSEPVVKEEEKTTSDTFARTLAQGFRDAGYTVSDLSSEVLPNKNTETEFTVSIAGGTVTIYVTDAATAELAQKTFDANVENDESLDLHVMEKGEEGQKTVEVIRNNMANNHFIEILDTKSAVTAHIEDTLPEQLDPVLNVLHTIGYPLAQQVSSAS